MKSQTFIAFSGGVESTTLCLLFGRQANAIFADTGSEHEEMYERIGFVEATLQKIHPDFRIIRVRAKETLRDYIRRSKMFPSQQMRFCTRMFKIEPINRFLSDYFPVTLMIGLNADETERPGSYPIEGVRFEYPLQDLHLSRAKCLQLLKQYNLAPSLPVYMRRGGCEHCFYKTRREYAALAHLNPQLATRLADFEEEVNASRGEQSAWTMANEIPEGFRAFFANEQHSLFSAQEMYGTQPEVAETPCGIFCHR